MTETKKFHDLPSASWASSKAAGIIQSKSRDLRNGGSEVGQEMV